MKPYRFYKSDRRKRLLENLLTIVTGDGYHQRSFLHNPVTHQGSVAFLERLILRAETWKPAADIPAVQVAKDRVAQAKRTQELQPEVDHSTADERLTAATGAMRDILRVAKGPELINPRELLTTYCRLARELAGLGSDDLPSLPEARQVLEEAHAFLMGFPEEKGETEG